MRARDCRLRHREQKLYLSLMINSPHDCGGDMDCRRCPRRFWRSRSRMTAVDKSPDSSASSAAPFRRLPHRGQSRTRLRRALFSYGMLYSRPIVYNSHDGREEQSS